MEGQVADESLEVYGYGRVMTDQDGSGWMRKPSGAIGTRGQGGAKGADNQGGADWKGRGGITGL